LRELVCCQQRRGTDKFPIENKNKQSMKVTCVHVHVKPENVQEFRDAIIENRKGTVREPGNIRFDILQQADDPCRFMIYEVFESESAVKMHKETPHYLKWRDYVKDFMAEDRHGVPYLVIEPSKVSDWE
jgi:autoinducer 2-degrading protein